MKKAQGISLNVIIVAAIGLVVLVLLVAITTGRMTIFGKSVDDTTGSVGDICEVGNYRKCGIAALDDTWEKIEPRTELGGKWSDCGKLSCYEKN